MTYVLTRQDANTRWGEVALPAEMAAGIGPRIVVRDAAGALVPSQIDGRDGGGADLVVDLAHAKGDLVIEAGQEEITGPLVTMDTLDDHQGQTTHRITTPHGDWYYHVHGAGFASLVDADGKDWLSFRPWGGSDGIYRGIPNLAHPENVFHPGAETCVTDPPRVGPLRVTLDSHSKDGDWACRWHIYPDHAELTVLKVGHPYWLLYEGTPHGELDEARDFCLLSTGDRRSLSQSWDEVLPAPKWIAFGKDGVDRTLWLHSHTPQNAETRDSYWPMEHNMTVFGFGRLGLEKFMTHVPARFTVGLAETASHDALARHIARSAARAALTLQS